MEYFRTNPLGWGSTYQSHPVALSCAYGVVKYMIDNKIVKHAENMEKIILNELEKLMEENSNCIAQARINGMAGCIDIMNPETNDIICTTNEVHPKMIELKRNLFNNGFVSLVRGPLVHIAPPLISKPEDIKYGFDILNKSLHETFH